MKKSLFVACIAAFCLIGASAIAQTVPQVTTIDPTNDRVQVIPQGKPSVGNKYASPAQLNTTGYYEKYSQTSLNTLNAAGTGYDFTLANYQGEILFDPGSTLSYSYITFSPNPSDGARQCIFSTAAITSVYLSANTGQTLNDAITAAVANTRYCYTYSSANLSWDRSN